MELFALASLALVAGVVSFTAPCTLPLLPGYVAYISGMSDSEQTVPTSRVLLAAALFVAGFSAVFVALGVTASGLGLLLAQNGRLLELVGGVFIVAMGLVTAGVLRIGLLQRQLRVDMSRVGRGPRAAACGLATRHGRGGGGGDALRCSSAPSAMRIVGERRRCAPLPPPPPPLSGGGGCSFGL